MRSVARDSLRNYGLDSPSITSRQHRLPVLVLALSTAAALVVAYVSPQSQLSSVILLAAALVVGYQQWIEARYEAGMDRYYERLDLGDRRLDAWEEARAMFPNFWCAPDDTVCYRRTMYTYVELDNLEYVVEKYCLGHIAPEHAMRGLDTFRSRCESPEFRKLLRSVLEQRAGYQPATRKVAITLCDEAERIEPATANLAQ